jgi:hypothetical protein
VKLPEAGALACGLRRARRCGRNAQGGTKPSFEARCTGATLWFERHFYPSLSQALALGATPVFQRETMGFLRGLGRLDEHWILEASNILPETKGPCISARP